MLVATAGVVAVVASIVAVVARLGEGTAAVVVAVVLGLAVVPIVASPLEWFVHRFVYHEAVVHALEAICRVHTAHHYAYFPTWRYVTGGPARRRGGGAESDSASRWPPGASRRNTSTSYCEV